MNAIETDRSSMAFLGLSARVRSRPKGQTHRHGQCLLGEDHRRNREGKFRDHQGDADFITS